MVVVLVNLLILVILGVVVFYITNYFLDQAKADEPIRKIILLILLIVLLIAMINMISGHSMWGPMVKEL